VNEQLRKWRLKNKLSQAKAIKVFRLAGLPITLDALQSWEVGRRSSNPLAAVTLADFLNRNSKRQQFAEGKRNEPALSVWLRQM